MWGRVNICAVLFLLFTLTAVVLAAVARGLPNWVKGQYEVRIPKEIQESEKSIYLRSRAAVKELFETCSNAEAKTIDNFQCVTTPPCDALFCDIDFLTKITKLAIGIPSAQFIGVWERGLQERCETVEYRSASQSKCPKKKRWSFGGGSDAEKMDSQSKSISDMVLACIIMEMIAFAVRVGVMVVYTQFAQYSTAFRVYVLLPVADALLKVLSVIMFAEMMAENESVQLGFTLYMASAVCSILALIVALVDQYTATVEDYKPPPYGYATNTMETIPLYDTAGPSHLPFNRPLYLRQNGNPPLPPYESRENSSPSTTPRRSPNGSTSQLSEPGALSQPSSHPQGLQHPSSHSHSSHSQHGSHHPSTRSNPGSTRPRARSDQKLNSPLARSKACRLNCVEGARSEVGLRLHRPQSCARITKKRHSSGPMATQKAAPIRERGLSRSAENSCNSSFDYDTRITNDELRRRRINTLGFGLSEAGSLDSGRNSNNSHTSTEAIRSSFLPTLLESQLSHLAQPESLRDRESFRDGDSNMQDGDSFVGMTGSGSSADRGQYPQV